MTYNKTYNINNIVNAKFEANEVLAVNAYERVKVAYNIKSIEHATFITKSVQYQELVLNVKKQKTNLEAIPLNDSKERTIVLDDLEKIEKQLNDFKKEVILLADFFSRIQINNSRIKLAKSLFENGQYYKADEILKSEDILSDLECIIEREKQFELEKEEINNKREHIANEFLIKAKLWKTFYSKNDWFNKTIEYFKNSILAKESFENLYEYGLFLQTHQKIDEALSIFEKISFSHLKDKSNIYISSLENIGLLYKRKYDFIKAEVYLKKVINFKLDYNLTEDLVTTYNNIAGLYKDWNKFSISEEYFYKALSNLEKHADSDIKKNALKGLIYSNLSELMRSLYNDSKAIQLSLESLKYWGNTTKVNNDFLPQIAVTLNTLGNIMADNSRNKEAIDYYLKSLEIRNKLYSENPYTYIMDLERVSCNLGLIYAETNELKKSRIYYEKCSGLFNWLKLNNYEIDKLEYSKLLINISLLEQIEQNFEESENCSIDAVEIREELAVENFRVFGSAYANSLKNAAFMYLNFKDYKSADEYFQEYIDTSKKLTNLSKKDFEANLAIAYSNVGNYYRLREKYTKAESFYNKALLSYKYLVKENKYKYEVLEANCLYNLGAIFFLQGNNKKGYKMMKKVKMICKDYPHNLTSNRLVQKIDSLLGEIAH